MSKYKHADRKIKELEEEIKFLNKSLDYSAHLNKTLQNRFDEAEKQRINYRKVIRYHSLLLILMSLLSQQTKGNTDIDKLIKRNIMDFYSAMCKDLMEIPNDDNEIIDNEFEDEEERYDESESDDLWDGEEEFE
jgi:hypothetical protein